LDDLTIWRLPKTGGTAEKISELPQASEGHSLFVDDSYAYFSAQVDAGWAPYRVPLDGGGPPVSLIDGGGSVGVVDSVVAADGRVYWAEGGGNGRVKRWTSGTIDLLLQLPNGVGSIGTDEDFLYWGARGSGNTYFIGGCRRDQCVP